MLQRHGHRGTIGTSKPAQALPISGMGLSSTPGTGFLLDERERALSLLTVGMTGFETRQSPTREPSLMVWISSHQVQTSRAPKNSEPQSPTPFPSGSSLIFAALLGCCRPRSRGQHPLP